MYIFNRKRNDKRLNFLIIFTACMIFLLTFICILIYSNIYEALKFLIIAISIIMLSEIFFAILNYIEFKSEIKIKASKTGLFLSRFQPIHNGHLYVIEKMYKECEDVYICIGSANKCKSLRNPLPVHDRELLVKEALKERGLNTEKIHIIQLPDWSMESKTDENKMWGKYLYFNVVSEMQKKYFTIYYSDNPKYIKKWFKSEIKKYIFIKSLKRDNIANGISATKIREALLNKDYEYVKENCPKCIYDNRGFLHTRLKLIADNPKDDYSM